MLVIVRNVIRHNILVLKVGLLGKIAFHLSLPIWRDFIPEIFASEFVTLNFLPCPE